MALFVSQSESPETDGNLALARTDDVSSSLRLVDVVSDLVSAEDLRAVLAPCVAAGVHAQAPKGSRDLAWHKSLFARACWEMARDRGCGMQDACAMVAIADDRRWRLVPGPARNYGNVRRWIGQLGKARGGVPTWSNYGGLVKGHGGGRKSTVELEFLTSFAKAWLRPTAPSAKAVLDGLAPEFRRAGKGDLVPSYDAVANYIRTKMPADVVARCRSKKGQWGDEFMGFVRRRCNCAVGDVIFGDHRIMDIWVRVLNDQGEWVAVRPWITAWMDARSGYLTAATIYTAEHPNHRTILDTFLLHIRRCGNRVPRDIYCDNGADYIFKGFSRPVQLSRKRSRQGTASKEILADKNGKPYEYCILDELGVGLIRAPNYRGQTKPVEREFKNHAQGWEQPWAPGYLGNCPANRPDQMLTWKGDVMRLPTTQQAQDDLNYWVDTVGHERVREEGRTKRQMWEEADFSQLVEFTETDLQYRMLVPDGTARLVCQGGLGPCIRYANWEYGHAALRKFWGQPMMVKMPWRVPTTERTIYGGRKLGKTAREVPVGIFVFTLDGVLVALCPAAPQIDMFADTEEERRKLGDLQHMINAIGAMATDGLEELTGSRQMVSDPRRVLAEIAGAASERPAVRQIIEGAAGERKTRRLGGEGGNSGVRIQESEGGMGMGKERPAVDTSALAAWQMEQLTDDDDVSAEPPASDAGAVDMADWLEQRGQDDDD